AKEKTEQKRPRIQTKTSAAGADAAAGEMEQRSSNENMVRTVVNEVHEAISKIMDGPMFKDIVEQEPCNMSSGGAQAPFKQVDMSGVLKKDGPGHSYQCGLIFTWQSFACMRNHSVPINEDQITELQRFALERVRPPRHIPFEAATALDSATQCVMGAKGALQRLSPPEPAFAAIEMDIVSQLSVRQWIYDVVSSKAPKEKGPGRGPGSAQVAKYYHEKVKSDEHLMEKNPWSKSIHALQALVDRAQPTARITWAMRGLTELHRTGWGTTTVGEFTISRLKDYRQSYIEVLNLKHAMRDELLQTCLAGIGLPIERVKKRKEAFADFPEARASATGYPDRPTVDATWMVGRPPSSVAACTLLEELICTVSYDGRYRDAAKTKAKVADILEHESVKREIDEVAATLAQERSAAAVARGETPAVDGAPATSALSTGATAGTSEPKGFHFVEQQDQEHWEDIIKKHVQMYVDTIVEKESAAEMENAIRNSTLATIRGDPTGPAVSHVDAKQSGEPSTRPELRIAPLRDENYRGLVRTVLSARAPAGATPGIRSGEVVILLDGGRSGNANKLIAPWREGASKDKTKHSDADEGEYDKEDDSDDEYGTEVMSSAASVIIIICSEASTANRRKKLRSHTGGIHQSGWCHMLAHSKICLPERARKRYAGTTSGDTIMGVAAVEPDIEWTMSWADKKALYGKKNLIAVGGNTKGASPDDVVERKTDSAQVPVTHRGMPPAWCDEIIHMFFPARPSWT
ncbi:unnamed protein product, partial [Prorocentrum cordatum]